MLPGIVSFRTGIETKIIYEQAFDLLGGVF